MLLQFIGIEEGHKTIEVAKVGTQKEIASAYRDSTTLPTSPSSYTNMYGAIPYAYATFALLRNLSPISNYLVRATKQSSPIVQNMLASLFGHPTQSIDKYAEEFRKYINL